MREDVSIIAISINKSIINLNIKSNTLAARFTSVPHALKILATHKCSQCY